MGLYYGSAKLGYTFGFAGPVAAIVWLPVGVAVSGLSLFGLALWPGVLAGDLLANDYSALPIGGALGQTCGNLLEVLVAAWLIRRLLQRGKPLRSLPGVAHVVGALALGTAISAVVGPVSLALAGVVKTDSLFEVARTWWLGDLCGALVVVPLAIAWWPPAWRRPALDRRLVEGALLLVVVATLAEIAAHSHQPVAVPALPGADLGGGALRRPGRNAGGRRGRVDHGLGDDPLRGAVRRRLRRATASSTRSSSSPSPPSRACAWRRSSPSASSSRSGSGSRGRSSTAPPRRSGAGSSARCTTAPSSGCSRSASACTCRRPRGLPGRLDLVLQRREPAPGGARRAA